MNAITLTAKRRRSGAGIAAAIKAAVAVLFGEHISTVITALALAAMFWHLLTIDDALLQGRRVAIDVNPDQPICIGMDYNATINWIVAGQPDEANRRLNVIKSFFVKYERKIPALVADFCQYYAYHSNKTVIYYYDTTALGSNYAVNDVDFRTVVIREFERHGWYVVAVPLGNPMHHPEKFNLINYGFAGRNRLTPYFNRQNNDDLILAIQSAGVRNGRNGFEKDKSGEKLAESSDDPLELRTDGTDAFDTLYIGCERKPFAGCLIADCSDFV